MPNPGNLEVKFKNKGRDYYLSLDDETVSQLEESTFTKKIKYIISKGVGVRFYVVKCGKQALEILVRADRSVFLSRDQQEIKPFTKHEEVLEEGLRREPEPIAEDESDATNEEENLAESRPGDEKSN